MRALGLQSVNQGKRKPDKKVSVYNAQHELLSEVPFDDLEAWVSSNGFIPTSRMGDILFVYPKVFEEVIREFDERKISVMRQVEDVRQFVDVLKSRVEKKGRVIVYPGKELLRHLYSIRGFVTVMNKILDENEDLEAFLPAGQYNDNWLFGVKRKST